MNKKNAMVVASLVVLIGALGLLWIENKHVWPKVGGRGATSVLMIEHAEEANLNQPFKVEVKINTSGNSVNAVGVYLRFEPEKMRLMNLETKQSFCQFYPEKKFDNNLGTISLACGSPHPGASGEDTLMIIDFLPLRVGQTTIRTAAESQILASDAKGTNLLEEFPQSIVTIVSSF